MEASATADDEPTSARPDTARPLDGLRSDDPTGIDGHELLGRISGFHLSDVYVARTPTRSKLCVMKVAGAGQYNDAERFRREAQYLARISSIRVAKVLGSGIWQGRPYLVQEFVDGPTLADVLKEQDHQPCDLGDSYRIARGLAEALRDVHRAGVVHRDVKPANIIIHDTRGATLVDFGIALADSDPRITRQGTTLGTPRYMSPEQASGAEAGMASDVFQWALVVGESMLGRPAIVGIADDWSGALHRCTVDPELDGALGRLVRHALDRSPDQRPTLEQILWELDRTERTQVTGGTRTIPLPEKRLADARSVPEARAILRPKIDDALDQLADRLGVFVAVLAVAVILGWVIGYFAGVVVSAPWGDA